MNLRKFTNPDLISLLSTAYKILSNILLASLTPYVNEIIAHHRIINVSSVVADLLQIRFSTLGRHKKKIKSIMGRCISY
jgi:hypothetical protein